MTENIYSRTRALLGDEKTERLKNAAVLVCGLGGVGGYVVEALARAGVGTLGLLDCDAVTESNLNRQIIATRDTIGLKKTAAARDRVLSVNPFCEVKTYDVFYSPDTADAVDLTSYDYIADAVDSVTAKIELIKRAKAAHIPIVSSMGTGNRLTADFVITDISKTSGCPLARVMRRELKARGIEGVKVLCSPSPPDRTQSGAPASISYVPAVAGLMIAGEIIRNLIK